MWVDELHDQFWSNLILFGLQLGSNRTAFGLSSSHVSVRRRSGLWPRCQHSFRNMKTALKAMKKVWMDTCGCMFLHLGYHWIPEEQFWKGCNQWGRGPTLQRFVIPQPGLPQGFLLSLISNPLRYSGLAIPRQPAGDFPSSWWDFPPPVHNTHDI